MVGAVVVVVVADDVVVEAQKVPEGGVKIQNEARTRVKARVLVDRERLTPIVMKVRIFLFI